MCIRDSGYLAGQAFEEYEKSGTVHGTKMPVGLKLADQLAEPIFTPSTKAAEGHDLKDVYKRQRLLR